MAVYYKKPYARKYRYSRSMRSGFPYKKRGFGKPKYLLHIVSLVHLSQSKVSYT